MLRDWSDEWKNARLTIELRGDELFQGETLEIVVHAVVTLDAASTSDDRGRSDSEAPLPTDELLPQLEARWRRHCDGALVDLKLVELTSSKQEKVAQQPQQQPRTTLFHQESRLLLLPVRAADAAPTPTPTVFRVALSMRCECTLRVRAEFWQRPLALVARIMPNSRADGSASAAAVSVQPLTSMLLSAEFRREHFYSLLQEQTIEPPNMTRRVEHKVRVAKPLALQMETRLASENHLLILARATNTHDTLAVRVLDLQLHANQLAGGRAPEYRLAKNPTGHFPVDLEPHEQYNFVFVVEPVPYASHDAQLSARTTASSQQQSLITLSWEAATQAGGTARPLLQPITEHHTILWSPHPHRLARGASKGSPALGELLELLPRPPPLATMALDGPNQRDAAKAVAVVRRGSPSCPLSVTLAPLDGSPRLTHRVGVVETLCVVVANKSKDATEFDLWLVVPPAQPTNRSWVAFEAAHHLGPLRSGTIVRKSVRLVFLRHGRADLNALLLFDQASRTWFLPPASSPASAWEAFVHP